KALRITDIAKEMSLNNPETRRHISRLQQVGLIQRDTAGYYNLSPYGEASMLLIQEFEFLSANRRYFETHTLSKLPEGFIKRIGELTACVAVTNPMDFFRFTENLLRESREYVWLLVDQFPLNSLPTIAKAIDGGIKIRVVEPKERILNPDLDAMTSEETQAFSRTKYTPLVEERMVDGVGVYLSVSDKRCVVAFPTPDGQFDFKGFTATDDSSLSWCQELFMHYWEEAKNRTVVPITQIKRGRVSREHGSSERVVVVGRELPEIDAQAVQDAVDNYDEVVLSGTFNFGPSFVRVSRSVVIKGEGREGDTPKTIIYKKGWAFPFTEYNCVFKLDGEDANVTIENIQFTDFNHTCIWGYRCNDMNIRNNRITLATGYGRGMMFGDLGDVVIGIGIWPEPGIFKGRVMIEGNYIDFARGGASGGFLARGGQEEDPEYRPNLFNHEYYMGFGIAVHGTSGMVNIENNIVRNTNARGIAATCNLASADVRIKHNTITSDLYGSYPFSSPEAGAGILSQSAWGFPTPGFNVEIEENTIKFDKLNYSGIIVLGPVTDREGANKLRDGVIRGNSIQLKDGYEGIHVRKCDGFDVSRNIILGEAYYGIRLSGRKKSGEIDLRSLHNIIEENDLHNLSIRESDEYSNSHSDGRMFSVSSGSSPMAHVWLDKNSVNNVIRLGRDESVIDEGTGNEIEYK
ncbi:MAG: right-handed parallel beta-helix repeat-containing protein, partial [Candidatus Bathyarchaeota archaeon]|nr:right-handed parallel beta-helix repeat-containing protein [Candidatus Bathyarchaeota archaeon]